MKRESRTQETIDVRQVVNGDLEVAIMKVVMRDGRDAFAFVLGGFPTEESAFKFMDQMVDIGLLVKEIMQ